MACVVAAFLPCLVRVALLPRWPIPSPAAHDEFSYLLAADTYGAGRLTNPPHHLWQHFESFHILQQPTYSGMYPMGPGLLLAVGRVMFGHPWWGVLLCSASAYATICWALAQLVEVELALTVSLATALAGGPLGVGGMWANSYWVSGLGTVGGSLAVGAMMWLFRTNWKHAAAGGAVYGLGTGILMHARPWEGMLLAAPAGAILLWKGLRCPERGRPVRAIIMATLVVACFAGLLGLDSWRVAGNPLRMPYALDRSQYATASVFIWEKPRPAPHYRHKVMEDFYLKWEPAFQDAEHFDTLRGWVGAMVSRAGWILSALGAISVLVFLRIRRRDERATPLLIVVLVFLVGTCLQRYLLLRYLAPVLCVCLAAGALLAQPLFLRWRQEYQARMRATMALGLVLLCAFPMLQLRHDARSRPVLWQKQAVERHLEEIPGRHAVLVRYSPQHALGSEWVYNKADIDGSRLVWGRAMNEEADRLFLQYYRDRHVWLVEADTNPVELKPLDAAGSSGPVEYIRLAGDR